MDDADDDATVEEDADATAADVVAVATAVGVAFGETPSADIRAAMVKPLAALQNVGGWGWSEAAVYP